MNFLQRIFGRKQSAASSADNTGYSPIFMDSGTSSDPLNPIYQVPPTTPDNSSDSTFDSGNDGSFDAGSDSGGGDSGGGDGGGGSD